MSRMYDTFDGSKPELIEAERALFEADAEPYGFDLARNQCAAPEPWSEYESEETGHRWGGWLAARSVISNAGGEWPVHSTALLKLEFERSLKHANDANRSE